MDSEVKNMLESLGYSFYFNDDTKRWLCSAPDYEALGTKSKLNDAIKLALKHYNNILI